MPIDLVGKPIVISGASSGIGLATARACARAGMPVALGARRVDLLERAAAEINAAGGRAIAGECDVSREGDCERLVERAAAEFGGVYAVFANAGYAFESPVETTPDERMRDIFEVNFWGSLRLARAGVRRMRAAGSGHVLLCSSCLSKIGMPYFGAYSATKAAQDHVARAMRHELGGTGIHVSSVHPIGTRTEFFEQVERRSEGPRLALRTGERFMQPPERVARAIVRCLRRPRGEVWTSLPVRTALGLATVFPGAADRVLGWALRRRL